MDNNGRSSGQQDHVVHSPLSGMTMESQATAGLLRLVLCSYLLASRAARHRPRYTLHPPPLLLHLGQTTLAAAAAVDSTAHSAAVHASLPASARASHHRQHRGSSRAPAPRSAHLAVAAMCACHHKQSVEQGRYTQQVTVDCVCTYSRCAWRLLVRLHVYGRISHPGCS